MDVNVVAHTPGPWIVWEDLKTGFPVRVTTLAKGPYGSEELVAHTYGLPANARLIAAAPDLLEALKDIDWDDQGTPTGWPTQDRVLALIAKAEGR